MFLVVNVLQVFVFDAWHVPFSFTVLIFIILILLYTYRGGIKTIIWTDTVQTTFMLLALVVSIIIISKELRTSLADLPTLVYKSDYCRMLFTDWHDRVISSRNFSAVPLSLLS